MGFILLHCECDICTNICESCEYSHPKDHKCRGPCLYCGRQTPNETCKTGKCKPCSEVCEYCGYTGPEIVKSARQIAQEKGEIFRGCCNPTYYICGQCDSTKSWDC